MGTLVDAIAQDKVIQFQDIRSSFRNVWKDYIFNFANTPSMQTAVYNVISDHVNYNWRVKPELTYLPLTPVEMLGCIGKEFVWNKMVRKIQSINNSRVYCEFCGGGQMSFQYTEMMNLQDRFGNFPFRKEVNE